MSEKPKNSIICRHCGVEIESTYRHDFVVHACDAITALRGQDAFIAVDGGKDYGRVIGDPRDWKFPE